MPDAVTRRLSAIVSADVVGYSRLMAADEAGTLRRLQALRRELVDPLIAEHHGRIVKTMGDGLLLEFPSVVEAVACAVGVQRGVLERDTNLADDQRIKLRIGAHLGDVIVDGDDVFGDGVNLAARLQEVAAPNGVALSALAHESVVGRVDAEFVDQGLRELKNIPRPVGVWAWRADGAPDAAPYGGRGRDPLAGRRTVLAVTPFTAPPGELQDLADGLTDELLSTMGNLEWLAIVVDPGGDAPARFRLTGALRAAGGRIRLQTVLRDEDQQRSVWTHRYDGNLDEGFEWQDSTVIHLASTVRSLMLDLEYARLAALAPARRTADDWFVIGSYAMDWGTQARAAEAVEAFRQAMALDPTLALAYSRAAVTCYYSQAQGWDIGVEMDIDVLTKWAETGAALAPQSGEAVCLAGVQSLVVTRNLAAAETLINRALELDPHAPYVLVWSGWGYLYGGRPERAIALFSRALEVSPLDRMAIYVEVGLAISSVMSGRYEAAIEHGRKAIAMSPSYVGAHRALAAAYAQLGRSDEALAECQELQRLAPGVTIAQWLAENFFVEGAAIEHYAEGLRKAGLPEA